MSRLDDELRNTFRREQPSSDFTAHLLERIAQQPAPRVRWWQRLATVLDPPKLRWVAVGVTASLLIAIGAAQYSRLHRQPVSDATVTKSGPPANTADKDIGGRAPVKPQPDSALATAQPQPNIGRSTTSSAMHRLALARSQGERQRRIEGEAAKQKLMLALSIASTALNDAQKAIRSDGPNR